MNQICNILGLSRQGYYKGRKKKQRKKLQEEMIIKLVQSHRRKMPLIGGKKLYKMLIPDFERMKIKIGRDRFFSLLRKNELLVRRKRRFAKTTNSSHRFKIYKNLTKGVKPMNPDEIYVSDITYLRAEDSFCY